MTARRPVVLVVDDEPLVRRVLRRELATDFEVLEAGNPAEGWAMIAAHTVRIDAVVSDLNMDGDREAGWAFLDEVARALPACARILVSGSLGAQLGQLPGVDASVAKPWRAGEVLAVVRRLLAR